MPKKKNPEDRFWDKVSRTAGCWFWNASTMPNGYGTFRIGYGSKRTSALAHRFSYKISIGEIPDGMMVLHRCDTRNCVRPDHLFLGTAKDNTEDMIRKGRQKFSTGAKLTRKSVDKIRARLLQGDKHKELAKEFHVSRSLIGLIKARTIWK